MSIPTPNVCVEEETGWLNPKPSTGDLSVLHTFCGSLPAREAKVGMQTPGRD